MENNIPFFILLYSINTVQESKNKNTLLHVFSKNMNEIEEL